VAKMVRITGPANDAGSTDYEIDATEVTRGQYESWVATNPALPSSGDTACGLKSTYAADSLCMATSDVCQGAGCDHHPQVCVDWCDAYDYCAAVDKRLCGSIGGASSPYSSYAEATRSQWYRACSSGGADTYPYGNTYQGTYCNGSDRWASSSANETTLPVASLSSCQSLSPGYAGVFDLSGNVWEWEDCCHDTIYCELRGGSFVNTSTYLACGHYDDPRNIFSSAIGFRCCSP
jgi:formylglycine-generating enzyme